MAVQDIIKSRRKELKLTLKEVAERLHVSEGTVSRYESGEIQNMGIDKIASLARALECSPGYLMGWEKKPAEVLRQDDPKKDRLLAFYESFNSAGKEELLRYAEYLDSKSEYKKGLSGFSEGLA